MKKTFIILSLIATTSCASIVGEGKQDVNVKTIPAGAEITIDGVTKTSPAVFTLKGKDSYTALAEKRGYRPTQAKIGGEVQILPAVVGNLFNFTGIVGMAIDFFATGAAYELEDDITIELRK